MPLHTFICDQKHVSELYQPQDGLREFEPCPTCGAQAQKHFLKAPIGRVVNIAYTSPIDGRPITTKAQRIEDLARNNCVEYDPEMKTDYMRRKDESERRLDQKLDATVESEIHSMGARKREKLEAEFRNGADIGFERSTLEG